MPLIGTSALVTDPDAGVLPTPPTVAYRETVGKPVFSWVDPDGAVWPLSETTEDIGWFTLWPSGTEAAPIEITTDPRPRGGESVRAISQKPASIQWPLEIFGSTHAQFVSRYRQISRAFKLTTRRERPGLLITQRPDATTRVIEAFYAEGLSGEPQQGHLFARPVITLFCPDGKWRDEQPQVLDWTFAASGGGPAPVNFFAPYLSLADSRELGSGTGEEDDPASLTTVTNPGDEEAWPVWTITGPLTQFRAWSTTLDARFTFTYPLTAGQSVTISTDPDMVRGPAGENLSEHINWFDPGGTELWPLSDGPNLIGLAVEGAGTGTAVRLTFYPRYDNS